MSEGWRFIFSARWARYFAFAVLFAVACGFLSAWQVARREEALHEIAKIQANYDAAPVPLRDALGGLESYAESQEWTPVLAKGRYLTDDQLLVRNRSRGGQPGFEVLAPLLLEDGSVFIVDRGWLPGGSTQDAPDEVPDPPGGDVQVVVRLKAGEPAIPGRSAPAGQIATIQLDDIAERLALPSYTRTYGLLASESPAAPTTPAPALRPELDEGPHLSYAFQWIVFALIGFGGLFIAVRQEYRYRNADDPQEQAREARKVLRRERRAPDDAAVEDAMLDR